MALAEVARAQYELHRFERGGQTHHALLAESLVESLTADFEPEKYHDEYREEVMALIQMKADGEEFEAPAVAADKPKVVDIMAALEASVAAAKDARGRHPAETSKKKSASKKQSA